MTARLFTTADKPIVPLATITRKRPDVESELIRLRKLAAALLSECDRGPGQTSYWPGLEVAMRELREELRRSE